MTTTQPAQAPISPAALIAALRERGAEEAQTSLPLDQIGVEDGFNPRHYFDPDSMRSLADDIREHGVLQPIVVRPNDEQDGFLVVAGERRFRAATTIGLPTIKVVLRLIARDEALAIAVAENGERDDISPAEEARVARRAMHIASGDTEEAARLLGWGRTKVARRLKLLHCADPVLDALERRQIMLGHAELLSTLPLETQQGTLQRIVEMDTSVAALKERISAFALELGAAIFDRDQCSGCRHNTEKQAELFAEHIGSGRCGNRECFHDKTAAAILARQEQLRTTHNAVFLDTEREPGSFKVVLRDGDGGVGRTQFETGCNACAHFGVLLGTQPGQEGTVEEDRCFDPACWATKNAAHLKAIAEARPRHSVSKSVAHGPTTTKSPGKKAATGSAGKTPKAVEDFVDGFYCRLAAKIASSNTAVARAVMLYALLADAQHPSEIVSRFGLPSVPTRATAIPLLIALNEEQATALEAALVEFILQDLKQHQLGAGGEIVRTAKAIAATVDADLRAEFVVDQGFLEAHTKAGIEAVLRAAGFDKHYEKAHSAKGAFGKLLKLRVSELLKAVMGASFDWKGFVPGVVQDAMDRAKQRIAQQRGRDSAARL